MKLSKSPFSAFTTLILLSVTFSDAFLPRFACTRIASNSNYQGQEIFENAGGNAHAIHKTRLYSTITGNDFSTPTQRMREQTHQPSADVRVSPTFVQKSPRILKSVSPFGLSALEREYLTGVSVWIGRFNGYSVLTSVFVDKLSAPKKVSDKVQLGLKLSLRAPQILSKLYSPLGATVTENTLTVDANGKIDVEVSNEAIGQRLAYLILEDLNNVREGIYPMPSELKTSQLQFSNFLAASSTDFYNAYQFAIGDTYSGQVNDYSAKMQVSDRWKQLARGLDLPQYYKNDFHSVPGGFLAPEHVKIYDLLSQIVFLGSHFMVRRMMLRPIAMEMRKNAAAYARQPTKLLDIGTGTGTFLLQANEAFPNMEFHAVDLSPAMIEHAKQQCQQAGVCATKIVQGNMENMQGFAKSQDYDFVTHSNCFHEMPETAIRNTAKEVARVLKPGGLFIHNDAMQAVDDAAIANLAQDTFSRRFVEPYMQKWIHRTDLDSIMAQAGLYPIQEPQPYSASCVRAYRRM